MPSIARPSTRGRARVDATLTIRRALVVQLCEQRLDTRGVRHALIELERDLRRDAQPQRTADARSQVARHAFEPVERCRPLGLATQDAYIDFRVPKIACDVDARHRHEPDDARVLYSFGQK